MNPGSLLHPYLYRLAKKEKGNAKVGRCLNGEYRLRQLKSPWAGDTGLYACVLIESGRERVSGVDRRSR